MSTEPLAPMPEGIPETGVYPLANQLNSVAVRLLRSIASADVVTGLTSPQASLLSVLVFGGPASIGQLAERERVSSPAITKHVDSLEERGLAERVRRRSDRRVVEVHATEAGRRLIDAGRAARVRALAGRLEHLTSEEQATVAMSLQLIYRSL